MEMREIFRFQFILDAKQKDSTKCIIFCIIYLMYNCILYVAALVLHVLQSVLYIY